MKFLYSILIVTVCVSAAKGVPTAYDADLPSYMDAGAGEYVLGYDTGYVNQTLDFGTLAARLGGGTDDNTLLITQGCRLISTNNTYVGSNGNSNSAVLEDGGSWLINGYFHIGWNGDYNSMSIAPGCVVTNTTNGYIGRAGTADYNSAVVSGGVWVCGGPLACGERGDGNTLSVIAGGTAACSEGRVAWQENSDSNRVTISGSSLSGTPSSWITEGAMTVGRYTTGTGNSVVVEEGGLLKTGNGGIIGRSGTDNTVTVRGSGSKWLSAKYLNVGWDGVDSGLSVLDGGIVEAEIRLSLGYGTVGSASWMTVTGENSLVTTTLIDIGRDNGLNSMLVSGSGSVFVTNAFNMGTNPGGSENSALITGAGSRLDVGNVIYVGNKGSSNTLAIADSALVKLDGYDIRFDWVAPATNNYLRLQAGYFAWAGSRAGSIASKEGYIQLWDDAAAEYKTLSDLTPEERTALNYSVTYYADDASAEVATGYSGLGGYTVVTGGILPAVEPPAVKPGLVILVK